MTGKICIAENILLIGHLIGKGGMLRDQADKIFSGSRPLPELYGGSGGMLHFPIRDIAADPGVGAGTGRGTPET